MRLPLASPDPFIPNATATQSYNRYSYCVNNPLKYTDPSGYTDKPVDWNKGVSGALYVNPCYMGGYTHLGPGSGNHWSDQYRSEFGNFMIGSSDGFDRIYGIGAWATALSVLTNPNLEWVSGKGNKPGIYVKEAKYHFNGWKGDKSSGYTADGEFELINRFIPFSGRENGETAQGQEGDGSLAMDIASGGATGFGLATSLRYKLEWEYLRQARINRAISGDFSKPIKHSLRSIRWAGSGFTIAGGIIGGVNFAISDKSWGDYGQLGVSMLSTGLTLGSATAPIGIGIGLIDAFGGFNGFYNYLDNQQNFYNNTGGIMVPINGIPSFIPLK